MNFTIIFKHVKLIYVMDELTYIDEQFSTPDLNQILKGKNVLIFDLETTGLYMDNNTFGTYKYKCYEDNSKYNATRILEIGWKYIENYNSHFDTDDVKSFYRKSKDITKINNTNIHGITLDCINKQ